MKDRYRINTRLATKDGQAIGNALIIDVSEEKGETFYRLKTDYGNVFCMNVREIL